MSVLISVANRVDEIQALQTTFNGPTPRVSSLATLAEIRALRVNHSDSLEDSNPEHSVSGSALSVSTLNINKNPDLLNGFVPMPSVSKGTTISRGLARYDGKLCFAEPKYISGPVAMGIIRKRAENLALLNAPKDHTFRTLHCEALFQETERFVFVDRHPTDYPGQPRSLLDFLSVGRKYCTVPV